MTRRTSPSTGSPSVLATSGACGLERELEHPTARDGARSFERGLHGRDPAEGLADRVHRDEPADPLAGDDKAFVPQQLQRPADRDPADAVLVAQLRLARQRATDATGDAVPERVGEIEVAHDLYCTCLVHRNTNSGPRPRFPPFSIIPT